MRPDVRKLLDQQSNIERLIHGISFDVEEKLINLAKEELRKKGRNTDVYLSVPGMWECEGGIGTCVYDDDDDPMMDHCVFCYEPYERK